MKTFLFILALIPFAANVATASPKDVSLLGRTYIQTCGNPKTISGDFELTYENAALPWGSSVSLIYGWGGSLLPEETPFDWADRTETRMSATAPYTWNVKLSRVLHKRGYVEWIQSLNFVFRIQLPDGTVTYEKGSATPLGFYSAELLGLVAPSNCHSPGDKLPEMRPMPIFQVDRE